ncbi:MAG: ABC transporter permease subunit [Acidimicrobiia bacterium]|nr:ABC transporter permease subunit [Acidimicrobiia bacterium]
MFFQAAVLAAVAAFGLWLAGNLRANSEATNIPLSYDYLGQPARFPIAGSSFRIEQNVRSAIIVGVGNTARVAVVGIVAATLIGTLIGIARLSTNWLVSKAAKTYVELVRNVPLLVIIIFSYKALFLQLPRPQEATRIEGLLVLSVRDIAVPWSRVAEGKAPAVLGVLVVAGLAAWLVARWRRSVFDRTGQPARAGVASTAAFVVITAAGFVALGGPVDVTSPQFDEGVVSGGIRMSPEYAALLFALVLYTSSHIAEIVRGSIQAIPKGQTEAATALALAPGQRMRLVVLPQAMRIALPALTNQYLNLTKNSSLAVAISYFELTNITKLSIANRSPAVPSYGLLLVLYLALSLTIAGITNLVNRRLAVGDR